MRLFADRKGYSLSDKELVRCIRNKKGEKYKIGDPIPCYTEQEVFNALNIDYLPPE